MPKKTPLGRDGNNMFYNLGWVNTYIMNERQKNTQNVVEKKNREKIERLNIDKIQ